MVGWFGAAALAIVGGLKGQGNLWRQLPLVGALAATALFISWRVSRQSRERDGAKPANLDDETVVEVNTRVYLVYDEEKKLECAGTSQSPPIPQEQDLEKFTDTDDLVPKSSEVSEHPSHRLQRGVDLTDSSEVENKTGEESLVETWNVSKADGDSKDVDAILEVENSTGYVVNPTYESDINDMSIPVFLMPPARSHQFFNPEIPPIVGEGEDFVFESDTDFLKNVTEDSLSFCQVVDLEHHDKDIISVVDSGVAGIRSEGPMDTVEKVFSVVDRSNVSSLPPGEICESPQLSSDSAEGFASSHSSTFTPASGTSGVRDEETAFDSENLTMRELRGAWTKPELQLNDWVSRRGDSEVEDGRLSHPASGAESYPSPMAESTRGAFPFSYLSSSETCSSVVVDSKDDDFFLQSPPSNVKRVISNVKDLETDPEKSSAEEYAERLRVYDEYLADTSLSPTMRSQVLRAKATLERLYDSD